MLIPGRLPERGLVLAAILIATGESPQTPPTKRGYFAW